MHDRLNTRTLLAWSSLAALAAIPLIREWATIFDSTNAVKGLVGLLEVVFCLAVMTRSRVVFPRVPMALAMLWLIWATLAVAISTHPAMALVRHAEWLTHGVFGISVYAFVRGQPSLYLAIPRWILAGFVLYFLSFAIFRITLPSPDQFTTASWLPGFSNIRHLGYFATACLPLSLVFLLERRNGRDCVLALAAMTVAWFFLFWSGGRGPFVSLAGALVVIGVSRHRGGLASAVPWVAATAVPGAALAWIMAVPQYGVFRILNSFTSSATLAELSPGRVVLWRHAVEKIAESPLFGVGPDGYLFLSSPIDKPLMHPHSILLQAPLEWGIVGAVLFAACGTLFAFRLLTARTSDPTFFAVIWGLLSLVALAVIDGTLYHAQPLMLVALLSGLSAATAMSTPVRTQPAIAATSVVVACTVIFLAHLGAILQVARFPNSTIIPDRLVEQFPTALPGYGVGPRLRSKLSQCLVSDPPRCAGLAEAAAAYVRPPRNAYFIELTQKIHAEDYGAARRQLADTPPWVP